MTLLLTTIIFCTILVISCLSALHQDLKNINENIVYFLTSYFIKNFEIMEMEDEEDEK